MSIAVNDAAPKAAILLLSSSRLEVAKLHDKSRHSGVPVLSDQLKQAYLPLSFNSSKDHQVEYYK